MDNTELIPNVLEPFQEEGFIVIEGTAGDDDLTGTSGSDSIRGLGGDDTIDGLADDDILEGGQGNDSLIGGEGLDTLDGETGTDTMRGGPEDDSYFVNDSRDEIVELPDEGIDDVISTVSYNLSDNVENLSLEGTENLEALGNEQDNRISGNSGDNVLVGGAGQDTLLGNSGDDTLDGGIGNDLLNGGPGDDEYIVDSGEDEIFEQPDGGTDTVRTQVTYSLETIENVENIILEGEDNIDGFGNAEDNDLLGNDGSNRLVGEQGNDTLRGGLGNDTLEGTAGENLLAGGAGSDTYVLSSTIDRIIESGRGLDDRDTIVAPFDFILGDDIENLTLDGEEDLFGRGNELDNFIVGNAGNNLLVGVDGSDTLIGEEGDDTLNGSLGPDSMVGGSGNDLYFVNNFGDVVQELSSNPDEIDEVRTITNYTLPDNVERLNIINNEANTTGEGNEIDNFISGAEGDNFLSGLEGNDSLIGQEGDDTLDGGVGDDLMSGGAGNDTYVIDNENDSIVEEGEDPEETDTVQSFIDFTIENNIENLTLLGQAINGTGNNGNNELVGNTQDNLLEGLVGDDELRGGEGNDTLDGGPGVNTLAGGLGDDTYLVNNSQDEILEEEDEGFDTVITTVSFAFPDNVENVSFIGTGSVSLIGNNNNNEIIGSEGDDLLEGLGGDDTLIGLDGNDTLDGGNGADSMEGGVGNDTYIVNRTDDVVVETSTAPNEVDAIISSVSFDLVENVENITLTSDRPLNSVGNIANNAMTGNEGDNLLEGGEGNDTLDGSAGNDTLDGGLGVDSMVGGEGDDLFVVENNRDTVQELANQGVDEVIASIDFNLSQNLENLTLTGNATRGSGNDLDNNITGNAGDNNLTGGAGNDTLNGVAGNNRLEGGQGDDTYFINSQGDTITEIPNNGGTDTVISVVDFELSDPNLENLTLVGEQAVSAIGNNADNEITANNIGNQLSGLEGNDTLIGGDGDDTLDGTVPEEGIPGADSMVGGLGNDLYLIDNTADEVVEEEDGGIDTIQSSVPFDLPNNVENIIFGPVGDIEVTGNDADNRIVTVDGDNLLEGRDGNDTLDSGEGDDTLDGGEGADVMNGGLGSDIYFVDNVEDQVTEVPTDEESEDVDEVNSSVSFRLLQNVENLTLTGRNDVDGTGNNLDNVLNGNDGDNRLDGSTGADTMIGGAGNDTYVVENPDDVVIENGNDPEDIVEASIEYTLGDNIENLSLTGTGNITGTGNRLDNSIIGNDGNNTLRGEDGDDTLDGGRRGNNTLIGGNGDDTYIVTSTNTQIVEEPDEGDDTVEASANFTLSDNVDTLLLVSNTNINGTGNALDNLIIGNDGNNELNGSDGDDTLIGGPGSDVLLGGSGDDRLIGGPGQDTLTGGPGNDLFVYESPDQGLDQINQYVPNDDSIEVSASGFGGGLEAGGPISVNEFTIGSSATSSQTRFIYQQEGGNNTLFYDPDGSGSLPQVRLIAFSGSVDLTNNDIVVF